MDEECFIILKVYKQVTNHGPNFNGFQPLPKSSQKRREGRLESG